MKVPFPIMVALPGWGMCACMTSFDTFDLTIFLFKRNKTLFNKVKNCN